MVATQATPQGEVARDGERIGATIAAIERAFKGKREAIELALIALLARGHVLFEDVPGVGKTTLARSVAKAMRFAFFRLFTALLIRLRSLWDAACGRSKARWETYPMPSTYTMRVRLLGWI